MTVAYHRMFRLRPNYRWWKPIVAFVVGIGFYYLLTILWQEALLLVVQLAGGVDAKDALVAAATKNQQDASNPLVMLFTLGSLATMLPSAVIAVRILGLGRFGTLASVAGRIRWRWLARCIVPGVVYMVITIGLGLLTPASWQGESTSTGVATPPLALAVSIVLILLFVPFQAAGEEFAFRGFGMQTFGSWFGRPAIAIILPTIGFAFAHSYNVWGKLDVAALGVSFAYLTWRTGGLEAGVVAHVINNVVVFIVAAPVVSSAQSDGSPAGAAVTVIASAVYVLLVTRLAWKHRPARVAQAPGDELDPFSVDGPSVARGRLAVDGAPRADGPSS